jgi:hypothetical protein
VPNAADAQLPQIGTAANLQSEEMLSSVVERLLRAMREIRPTTLPADRDDSAGGLVSTMSHCRGRSFLT